MNLSEKNNKNYMVQDMIKMIINNDNDIQDIVII